MLSKFSPGLLKIVSNIGWLTGEKLFSTAVSFFVVIYVVKYLGAENFGKLSYCVSFVGLFEAITKLGLDGIVVRNLVKTAKRNSTILGTAFTLKLFGSLLTCTLIIITDLWLNSSLEIVFITSIIAVGYLFTAFDVIDYWFESQVQSQSLVLVRSIQLTLSSLAKICFVWYQLPLIAFIWLILVEYAIKSLLKILIYSQQKLSILKWKFNLLEAKILLKDSYPLILSSVMVAIYMKIDQVMLGNMVDAQAVGNYATAVKFSSVWYFIPVAICSSVFPSIIRIKKKSYREYYARWQQLYDLMMGSALMIAIGTTFLGKPLIISLLGVEYIPAANILTWHIWAGIFVFLGVARGKWLMIENLTFLNFISTALGAVTNVILNLLLIPIYQGTGAAIATLIAYAIAGYISCFFYPPLFKTGRMLTLALCLPLRIRQNYVYLQKIRKIFNFSP